MTRVDHLLWIAAEECMEIAQRISKAARFGIQEIQPGQLLTNQKRILGEIIDFTAVMEMIYDEIGFCPEDDESMIQTKKDKVEKFLKYSDECGRLD